MARERTIRTMVVTIGHDSLARQPFETLVKIITDAWDSIPPDRRASSGFEISYLSVWYDRLETDEDKRDRAEYERLKAKFENTKMV